MTPLFQPSQKARCPGIMYREEGQTNQKKWDSGDDWKNAPRDTGGNAGISGYVSEQFHLVHLTGSHGD